MRDSERYWDVLRDIEKYQKILQDNERYWETLRHIESYWKILRDIKIYWEILRDIERCHKRISDYFKFASSFVYELFEYWDIGILRYWIDIDIDRYW